MPVATLVAVLCLLFAAPVAAETHPMDDAAFWENVFEYHGTVMLVIDAETGAILRANDAASRFYQYTTAELEAMNIHDINQLPREESESLRRQAAEREQAHFVFPHRIGSGEIRSVEVYSWPIDPEQTMLLSIIHDVTDAIAAFDSLEATNQRLMNAEALARMGHWQYDTAADVVSLSRGAQRILGVSRAELTLAETNELFVPEERLIRQQALQDLMQGKDYDLTYELEHADTGETIYLRSIAQYETDTGTILGSMLDITEYVTMQEVLESRQRLTAIAAIIAVTASLLAAAVFYALMRYRRQAAERLAKSYADIQERDRQMTAFLDSMPGLAFRSQLDTARTTTFLHGRLNTMLGLDNRQVNPESPVAFAEYVHPDDHTELLDTWPSELTNNHQFSGEYRLQTESGETRWVMEQSQAVLDEHGTPRFAEGLIVDIQDRRTAQEQLEYLTFHDPVTGLYNRTFIEQKVAELNGQPVNGDTPGLIVVDVDGLKIINDSMGHQQGDECLRQAAEVLQRASPPAAIIARWGGDEFILLLERTREDELTAICEKIQDEAAARSGQPMPLSLSPGFAVHQDDVSTIDMDQLFRVAENRMYQHKINTAASSRSALVVSLQQTLDEKNHETWSHCERLRTYAEGIADALGLSPALRNQVTAAALLHDVGKVGIPETILNKPGPLTDEEWASIQGHPEIGHRITAASPDLAFVAEAIRSHHERWDGEGYPRGLQATDIPLAARIVAVADAFEVMTSGRPYAEARSYGEALAELEISAGTQFDPQVVAAFVHWMDS